MRVLDSFPFQSLFCFLLLLRNTHEITLVKRTNDEHPIGNQHHVSADVLVFAEPTEGLFGDLGVETLGQRVFLGVKLLFTSCIGMSSKVTIVDYYDLLGYYPGLWGGLSSFCIRHLGMIMAAVIIPNNCFLVSELRVSLSEIKSV